MHTNQLAQYYALIAETYDRVDPDDESESPEELDELQERVAEILSGHKVLEIACGTGYWTEAIAETAASVHATDLSPEMLALAKARGLESDTITFSLADAYDLPAAPGQYTACFAGFWWSHVKREDQERFLGQLRAKLGKDTLLVLIDNCYVDGATMVIARTDLEGNTHQIRTAPDGERYEILKNYPSDSALRKKMASSVREIRIERMEYYWLLTCRLK
ncbi:MAG: methyltransferase domain-containing protein [Pseudomonadota bacterium]